LLAATRARLAPIVAPHRTLFVVVKKHQCYYDPELSDVNSERIVAQPFNMGTSAAIIYGLLQIRSLDDQEAIVGFFPTDHHYADEEAFHRAIERGYSVARRCPRTLVLLAADPHGPEVDYGWIEPRARLRYDPAHSLYRVDHFCEKPSPQTAEQMLDHGCFWNTFVMFGTVRTFLQVLERTIPETLQRFTRLESDLESANRIYRQLVAGDFSRQVLAAAADRLIALRASHVGWSDLGTPERLGAAMTQATHQSSPYQSGISSDNIDCLARHLASDASSRTGRQD